MEVDYLDCEAEYLIERVEKVLKNVKKIQKDQDIKEISIGLFRNLNIFYNKNNDIFNIKVYFLFVVQKNTLANKEKIIEIYKKNSVLDQLEEIKIEKITEENKNSKIKQITKETVDTNNIRTGKIDLDLYNFNILIDVLHRKKFKEYSGSLLMAKTLISNFNNLCRIDFLKGE